MKVCVLLESGGMTVSPRDRDEDTADVDPHKKMKSKLISVISASS